MISWKAGFWDNGKIGDTNSYLKHLNKKSILIYCWWLLEFIRWFYFTCSYPDGALACQYTIFEKWYLLHMRQIECLLISCFQATFLDVCLEKK